VFDLSFFKLAVLAVIALIVFGPNELPRIARQVGRALRDLRQIAEGAKADLREGLGPEFQDFDFDDLNPKRFVQKHLFEDPAPSAAQEAAAGTMTAVKDVATVSSVAGGASAGEAATVTEGVVGTSAIASTDALAEMDDCPPFDFEAT
jgi:sec-independent protein translocase protein TatB